MKFFEKLPLPLEKILNDLKEMELDAIVTGTQVEYNSRKNGTDITLVLQVKIEDIYKERRKTEDQKYDDAMKVI